MKSDQGVKKRKETTKERLLEWNTFYSSKSFGIWIECSKCNKWRKVMEYEEEHEVPPDWCCSLSLSGTGGCDAPEDTYDECTPVNFIPGTIVWAKLSSYPWWPGMIEDDPDTEEYYWLQKNGMYSYNVTFLDDKVSRSWVSASHVRSILHPPKQKLSARCFKYRSLLVAAEAKAKKAITMSIQERLENFSFAKCYKGKWGPALNLDDYEDENNLTQTKEEEVYEIRSAISSNSDDYEDERNLTQILLEEVDDIRSTRSSDSDYRSLSSFELKKNEIENKTDHCDNFSPGDLINRAKHKKKQTSDNLVNKTKYKKKQTSNIRNKLVTKTHSNKKSKPINKDDVTNLELQDDEEIAELHKLVDKANVYLDNIIEEGKKDSKILENKNKIKKEDKNLKLMKSEIVSKKADITTTLETDDEEIAELNKLIDEANVYLDNIIEEEEKDSKIFVPKKGKEDRNKNKKENKNLKLMKSEIFSKKEDITTTLETDDEETAELHKLVDEVNVYLDNKEEEEKMDSKIFIPKRGKKDKNKIKKEDKNLKLMKNEIFSKKEDTTLETDDEEMAELNKLVDKANVYFDNIIEERKKDSKIFIPEKGKKDRNKIKKYITTNLENTGKKTESLKTSKIKNKTANKFKISEEKIDKTKENEKGGKLIIEKKQAEEIKIIKEIQKEKYEKVLNASNSKFKPPVKSNTNNTNDENQNFRKQKEKTTARISFNTSGSVTKGDKIHVEKKLPEKNLEENTKYSTTKKVATENVKKRSKNENNLKKDDNVMTSNDSNATISGTLNAKNKVKKGQKKQTNKKNFKEDLKNPKDQAKIEIGQIEEPEKHAKNLMKDFSKDLLISNTEKSELTNAFKLSTKQNANQKRKRSLKMNEIENEAEEMKQIKKNDKGHLSDDNMNEEIPCNKNSQNEHFSVLVEMNEQQSENEDSDPFEAE